MKTKKILRSCLAIICCMSMILGCVGMIAPEVKAAEQMPTGFTEVTPREFGIADFSGNTELTKYTETKKGVTSLDKVQFKAKVVFAANAMIYYCEPSVSGQSGGLNLWIKANARSMRFYNYAGSKGVYVGGSYVQNGE